MRALRLLDTFSGIGGFSYAAERIVGGFETVAFVEREPFCQQILSKHWPAVPIYDDITTFNPEPYSADVVCGGFPCQDISLAGKQAGIKEGTRSGLFYELMRVVRLVRPQYVVLENVSAILANGLDIVLGALAEAGFDAEWACIPASAVGACHQRDRWWLVAYPASTIAKQHEPHTWRQFEGRNMQTDWNSNQEISVNAAYPSRQGQQRPKPAWRHAAGSLRPNWGGYLSEPVLRRGDDGLSHRVDRIRALGNAVVPQVAAIPLARVKELANAQRASHPATDPPAVLTRSMPPLPQ
jgi:DNA (cytosine-5)-methyltransferase 1